MRGASVWKAVGYWLEWQINQRICKVWVIKYAPGKAEREKGKCRK